MNRIRTILAVFVSVAQGIAFNCAAQSERPDSVALSDTVPSYMVPVSPVPESPRTGIPVPDFRYDGKYLRSLSEFNLNYAPITSVRPLVPGVADLASWEGGSLSAYGGRLSLPGLMGKESGGIALGHSFGPVSVRVSAGADKYGSFRGLQTSYGVNATINYSISPQWSVTLFGGYQSHVTPLTPAMAGYMGTSTIGGYVSYDINDKWGVSVGAQANRSLVTNRWEAQPIVMPYYKINDNAVIRVDVGGIIYNMVKDYLESRDNYRGNPVIAPPRPGPPPVVPRR